MADPVTAVLPSPTVTGPACAGMANAGLDWWYSEDPAEQDLARSVCRRCPIIDTCLERSLAAGDEYGIAGGMDPGERRAVARLRGLPTPGSWRHGTASGYQVHRCRCDDCRAAHTREAADRRLRLRYRATPATRAPTLVVLDRPTGTGRHRAYPGQLLIPTEGALL